MAKIIKRGDEIYKCGRCGCEFEIEDGDVKEFDMTMDEGGFLGILPLLRKCDTVRCPQCMEKIIIKWR